MKSGRKRVIRIALLTTILAAAGVVTAPPAQAVCAIWPGTNPITIQIGPDPLTRIPGTPSGLVGVCVDVTVEGDPPQVDQEVTIEHSLSCGIPCFVVAWDGVTHSAVTVTVSVVVNQQTVLVSRTIPAGSLGEFCINAGMPCP